MRILLAEDDLALAQRVRAALEEAGYVVAHAAEGRDPLLGLGGLDVADHDDLRLHHGCLLEAGPGPPRRRNGSRCWR